MGMITKCWSQILLRCPGTIMMTCLCLSTIFALVSLFFFEVPDFSNPLEGFATKNTEISNRASSFRLLKKELQSGTQRVFLSPNSLRSARSITTHSDFISEHTLHCLPTAEEITSQARIVIKLDGFSAKAFEQLCSFDGELHRRGLLNHREHCKKADREGAATECCHSIHIAWLLAAANNGTRCNEVADETRQSMMATLEQCYGRSRKITTSEGSDTNDDDSIAKMCSKQTYKYSVDYLLPTIMEDGVYSMFILPYPSTAMKHIMNANAVIDLMKHHKNEVVGFDFAMKEVLFVKYLNTDVAYGFFALFLVSVTLLSSTCSPLFTIAVLLTIAQAMIYAYFTYRVLFRMEFFPFISLLAIVLLLGIGADDAFIFRQSWRRARNTASETPLVKLVECALERSFATMAVTSATTICALLANTVSHITAVKCFGVFAALCLLFNFILVLTWLPACLLYQHNRYLVTVEAACRCAWRILQQVRLKLPFENGYKQQFGDLVVSVVRIFIARLKYLTAFVFACLFILSLYILLVNPGVHLPSKDYFQYFRNGHIIEQYDAFYKHRFAHAKSKTIPLIFQLAYGFDPLRSSHYFKPHITEKLEIWPRAEFGLDNIDSLQELNRICEHISASEFITALPRGVFHPSACFVDKMLAYMERPCSLTLTDCCVEANTSYHIGNVSSCLSRMYSEYEFLLTQSADLNLPFGRALFVDDLENGRRYGIHIAAFLTNYTFTLDFAKMKRYYQIFDSLMNDVLKNSSSFFRKGFFLTEAFQFYDLQHSLLYETLTSALISIAIAFLILFIVIRDLLVCFISVLSIVDVMVTTGAILVLLGWELNVIESTIALLTVGLSFDFVLHYALAFCKSSELKRADRAVRSINEVICPVTMSMLTTFVTGFGMIFADTQCFLQIASFMMLIAIFGWLISTLFFTSMLACLGPETSRLPNDMISSSRRTSKISRSGENLYDQCLLSTSSFEQCSSRFPVFEQHDGRLSRCSRTGIHWKRSSGQLYQGDIRRASMPVAFTAFVNRRAFTASSEDRRRNSSIADVSRQHITKRQTLIGVVGLMSKSVG